MPFPDLAQKIETLSALSAQLLDESQLDLAAALGRDPGARAAALAPQLEILRDGGAAARISIAQTPVAELRANSRFVVAQLDAWCDSTAKLHQQLKAQFGDEHPTTVAAQEANGEASEAYGKTMVRMAVANVGSKVVSAAVGVASLLGRIFVGGT